MLEAAEVGFRDAHFVEEHAAALEADAAEQGVFDGARLLKDFLEHEVLIAALFRHDGIPKNAGNGALDGFAVEIGQLNAAWSQHGDIAVIEEEHIPGVTKNRGNVGGDEELLVAESDDDGRTGAGGDNLVGIGAGNDTDRKDAPDLFKGGANGILELAVEMLFNQVSEDFGIGFRLEDVAFGGQLFAESEVVLDDTVVYDDDFAFTVAMRMGVLFGRAAVRGPAGVPDAIMAGNRIGANRFFKVPQFARGSSDFESL